MSLYKIAGQNLQLNMFFCVQEYCFYLIIGPEIYYQNTNHIQSYRIHAGIPDEKSEGKTCRNKNKSCYISNLLVIY